MYFCRGLWSDEDWQHAKSAVRNRNMGLNQSAQQYGAPRATLKTHLDGKDKYAPKELAAFQFFSQNDENKLHDFILQL